MVGWLVGWLVDWAAEMCPCVCMFARRTDGPEEEARDDVVEADERPQERAPPPGPEPKVVVDPVLEDRDVAHVVGPVDEPHGVACVACGFSCVLLCDRRRPGTSVLLGSRGGLWLELLVVAHARRPVGWVSGWPVWSGWVWIGSINKCGPYRIESKGTRRHVTNRWCGQEGDLAARPMQRDETRRATWPLGRRRCAQPAARWINCPSVPIIVSIDAVGVYGALASKANESAAAAALAFFVRGRRPAVSF